MHKGEVLEKAIRQSGVPITYIAKRMKKSRMWVYNLFQNKIISIDVLLKIGEIIHYDFKGEILDVKEIKRVKGILEEPQVAYKKSPPKENKEEYWKDKYLSLLEKHNELLQTISALPKTNKNKK